MMYRHGSMKAPAIFAIGLGIAVGLVSLGGAQSRPSEPEQTFFESVDVRVVNVEVVVTDKDGKPVPGLKREDFTLTEDGKPVEISNFYGLAPVATTETIVVDPAAPAAPQPAPQPIPLETQQLNMAIFLDHRNLTPLARRRLDASLQGFFREKVSPGDRVLIAGYDGSLRFKQLPDGDPEALLAALQEEMKRSSRGNEIVLEEARVMSEIRGAKLPSPDEASGPDSSDAEAAAILSSIRVFARSQEDENRRTLNALAQVVDALAGLPGRKALVWATGGFSTRPGDTLFQAFQRKYEHTALKNVASSFEAFEFDSTPQLNDLAARANARRVTLYGLGMRDGGNRGADSEGDINVRDMSRGAEINASHGLQTVAHATGGTSIANAGDPALFLGRVRTDLEAAYSLGYVPKRRPDDKQHKIQVATRDRSLKVRYREGLRDQSTDERMIDRTTSALLLGKSENPLGAEIEFEEERPGQGGAIEVSVLVKIPMAKLVLMPQAHVHEGRMKVYVSGRDRQGRISPVTVVAAPIRVPNESLLTALGQVVGCRVTLVLKPGESLIAAAIWDDLGKSESIVTANYTAGAAQAAAVGK